MTSVVDFRPVLTGIKEWLTNAAGGVFEVARPPEVADIPEGKPWGQIHLIPGGEFYGSFFQDPDSDAEVVLQVDSVGKTPMQAMWLADNVRRTFLARTAGGQFQVAAPDLSPWKIISRRPYGPTPGVDTGGEPETRVYSVPERYVVCISPE